MSIGLLSHRDLLSRGIIYGSPIAFTIRSVDRSLTIRLIVIHSFDPTTLIVHREFLSRLDSCRAHDLSGLFRDLYRSLCVTTRKGRRSVS